MWSDPAVSRRLNFLSGPVLRRSGETARRRTDTYTDSRADLTCNSDHREWSENSANVILRLVSIPPTSCGALRMIAKYFLLGADPAPYDVGEGRDPLQEKDGTRIGSLLKLPLQRDGEGAPLEAAGAATSDTESGAANLDHIRVPAETPPRRDGEFLANVRHELRTPLHAVMGMAEALSAAVSLNRRITETDLLRPLDLPLKWAADIRAGSGAGTRKETFTGAPIDMGRSPAACFTRPAGTAERQTAEFGGPPFPLKSL
jgi:signal transduction histidine kinase